MAELKTKRGDESVEAFLASVAHPGRREDAHLLCDLMKDATAMTPHLWGGAMVGFGQYDYTYDSGHSGAWFLTGFAPRKANMVVYIMPGFDAYRAELAQLGKHRHSKSCLYLGRLTGLDLGALSQMVSDSVEVMKKRYANWSALS